MQDLMIVSDREPAGLLAVRSPFDGRELDSVSTSGPKHVEDAFAAAHGFFRDRHAWLSIPERIEILSKAAAIMLTVVANLRSLKVACRRPFANVRFWLRLLKKSPVLEFLKQ